MLAGSSRQGISVNRGEVLTPDWVLADLITDNAWHDLYLASIIPKGTVKVLIRTFIRSATINKYLWIRTKDYTASTSMYRTSTAVSSLAQNQQGPIYPNYLRKCEYKISNVVWQGISIIVLGWDF